MMNGENSIFVVIVATLRWKVIQRTHGTITISHSLRFKTHGNTKWQTTEALDLIGIIINELLMIFHWHFSRETSFAKIVMNIVCWWTFETNLNFFHFFCKKTSKIMMKISKLNECWFKWDISNENGLLLRSEAFIADLIWQPAYWNRNHTTKNTDTKGNLFLLRRRHECIIIAQKHSR